MDRQGLRYDGGCSGRGGSHGSMLLTLGNVQTTFWKEVHLRRGVEATSQR
jgi:hypothetical protein